jgi:MraZ protein
MLIGQYEGKLTNKNQISFPKKFRDTLGSKLIITKGIEEYLIIVSEKEYKTLLEGTEGKPFINQDAREMQRFILGNAYETELDSKGRCVLPEFLRNFAHLKEDIVFAGIGRFVELWDKEDWKLEQTKVSQKVPSIAKRLSQQDEK